MGDNCTNCLQAKLIEKLDERVSMLEKQQQNTQEKFSEIERSASVTEERTKTLFNMLKEIKESIAKIASKIETLEKKPADRWEEVVKTVIAVIIGAAFTYFLKK